MRREPTLEGEREIAQLVRQTVAAAGQAPPERLAALMPSPPRRQVLLQVWAWQAAAAACVLLLVGSLSALLASQPAGWQPPLPATGVVMTATSTDLPTATLAQAVEEGDTRPNGTAAVPAATVTAGSSTPVPGPTPVAAMAPILASN